MNNNHEAEQSSRRDEALASAYELGRDYSDWDREQLSQSAEMANDLAPEIRRLAGYDDLFGAGTYTGLTDDPTEQEYWNLIEDKNDLWAAFWVGYDALHDKETSAAMVEQGMCPVCTRDMGKDNVCLGCGLVWED